jgi:hypothetical protein
MIDHQHNFSHWNVLTRSWVCSCGAVVTEQAAELGRRDVVSDRQSGISLRFIREWPAADGRPILVGHLSSDGKFRRSWRASFLAGGCE